MWQIPINANLFSGTTLFTKQLQVPTQKDTPQTQELKSELETQPILTDTQRVVNIVRSHNDPIVIRGLPLKLSNKINNIQSNYVGANNDQMLSTATLQGRVNLIHNASQDTIGNAILVNNLLDPRVNDIASAEFYLNRNLTAEELANKSVTGPRGGSVIVRPQNLAEIFRNPDDARMRASIINPNHAINPRVINNIIPNEIPPEIQADLNNFQPVEFKVPEIPRIRRNPDDTDSDEEKFDDFKDDGDDDDFKGGRPPPDYEPPSYAAANLGDYDHDQTMATVNRGINRIKQMRQRRLEMKSVNEPYESHSLIHAPRHLMNEDNAPRQGLLHAKPVIEPIAMDEDIIAREEKAESKRRIEAEHKANSGVSGMLRNTFSSAKKFLGSSGNRSLPLTTDNKPRRNSNHNNNNINNVSEANRSYDPDNLDDQGEEMVRAYKQKYGTPAEIRQAILDKKAHITRNIQRRNYNERTQREQKSREGRNGNNNVSTYNAGGMKKRKRSRSRSRFSGSGIKDNILEESELGNVLPNYQKNKRGRYYLARKNLKLGIIGIDELKLKDNILSIVRLTTNNKINGYPNRSISDPLKKAILELVQNVWPDLNLLNKDEGEFIKGLVKKSHLNIKQETPKPKSKSNKEKPLSISEVNNRLALCLGSLKNGNNSKQLKKETINLLRYLIMNSRMTKERAIQISKTFKL